MTPLGQLVFFAQFLHVGGRWEDFTGSAAMPNPFDELKNQWGWAGFTTQDLNRCQVTARQTRHAGQTRISVNLSHAKGNKIKTQLAEASAFLQGLLTSAEQLGNAQRWERILLRIFKKFMPQKLLAAGPPIPATG